MASTGSPVSSKIFSPTVRAPRGLNRGSTPASVPWRIRARGRTGFPSRRQATSCRPEASTRKAAPSWVRQALAAVRVGVHSPARFRSSGVSRAAVSSRVNRVGIRRASLPFIRGRMLSSRVLPNRDTTQGSNRPSSAAWAAFRWLRTAQLSSSSRGTPYTWAVRSAPSNMARGLLVSGENWAVI